MPAAHDGSATRRGLWPILLALWVGLGIFWAWRSLAGGQGLPGNAGSLLLAMGSGCLALAQMAASARARRVWMTLCFALLAGSLTLLVMALPG